jgi:hypothetical protein
LENYNVKIYHKKYYNLWNKFVADAKNATFLFHRDFMEYHQDRFHDFSLLVFDDKDALQAILPANYIDNQAFTHQGLTFGGLVLMPKSYFSKTLKIFQSILCFLNQNKIDFLYYKEIPSFYNTYFADEMSYLIFQTKGILIKKELNSVINLQNSILINKGRLQSVKISKKKEYKIKQSKNPKLFWNSVLIPLLEEKHLTKPTHSLDEIKLLMEKFPNNIQFFEVWENDDLKAGTILFTNNHVIHCQYIAKTTEKENFALDFLFNDLIFVKYKNYHIFDFGISNEENGTKVNEGLLYWKESLGGRNICQNLYKIETKNYVFLNQILK